MHNTIWLSLKSLVPINDKKFDICAKVQHGNNTGYWLVGSLQSWLPGLPSPISIYDC